jgi:hypothetical protein
MDIRVVNLKEKAGLIHELNAYKVIARINDYHFKLVKARRDFIWHHHSETDEIFMVIEGKMRIALRTGPLSWEKGNSWSYPRVWITNPFVKNSARSSLLSLPALPIPEMLVGF